MKMTEEGLALIRQYEGFRGKAYRDPVGIWTIGYGHTSSAGAPEVTPGLVISRDEAAAILVRDVAKFADGVRREVKTPLNDAQFSALVSFAYNVGLGAFKKSSVLAAINANDFEAVPRRLNLWVKAGGHVLPGLVKRRAAEGALFLSAKPVSPVDVPHPVEPIRGKPMGKSKTAWSAGLAALVAVAQGFLLAGAKLAAGIAALAIVALAVVIIRERYLKSREEGL
jgi:lysozyme